MFERAGWAPMPDDLPLATAVDLFDVCAAASQVDELVFEGADVCVLGAGHAGKLALAPPETRAATLIVVDVDRAALAAVDEAGLCDLAVEADLRDPLAALAAVREAGAPPADLTVVVVNAPDCEPTALLLTADAGTILFFSMSTSFSARGARRRRDRDRGPDGGRQRLLGQIAVGWRSISPATSVPLRRALGLPVGGGA